MKGRKPKGREKFKGMKKKKREHPWNVKKKDLSRCPVCEGYGGWIIELDAYGEGEHFEAGCSQCNGWGWVHGKDAECVHDLGNATNIGRCLTRYTCKKCGKVEEWDSSD